MMCELNICHLYPDLLNLYGDRGNVITIRKRCEWMGIRANVSAVSMGDPFDAEKFDIVFIGGGQDYEQGILQPDFVEQKGAEVRSYIENGGVLLTICGGFQLLGNFYRTADGQELKFLGAMDFASFGGDRRMIGDLVFQSDFLKTETPNSDVLVAFENHSAKTVLGPGVKPFGRVLRGFGNNGDDQTEGVQYKNTIGSYGHGSLLPKNPALADHLIKTALQRKYGNTDAFVKLDDTVENLAHTTVYEKAMRTRKRYTEAVS